MQSLGAHLLGGHVIYLREDNDVFKTIVAAEVMLESLGITLKAHGHQLRLTIGGLEYKVPDNIFPRTIDEPFTRSE